MKEAKRAYPYVVDGGPEAWADMDECEHGSWVSYSDYEALNTVAADLLKACEEFVRKVECGEARSKRSYQQMKAAIAKAKGE